MVPVFDRRKLRPLILALAIALCAFQLTTCTGMWLLDPLIVRATPVGLVLSMLFLWRSSNRALRKNWGSDQFGTCRQFGKWVDWPCVTGCYEKF